MSAGTDDPQDRLYQKAYSRWLDRHPQLGEKHIKKPTRYWLFLCYDHQSEISDWRKEQGTVEMTRYNYPETVFTRWARKERPGTADRDPERGTRQEAPQRRAPADKRGPRHRRGGQGSARGRRRHRRYDRRGLDFVGRCARDEAKWQVACGR
jgi:hypothetical protein